MSTAKLVISSTAIVLVAAAFAAGGESPDATAASVAALKSNLGNPDGLVIDEVRVTDAGVACIEYRVGTGEGGKIRGHAVVQRDEVIKSTAGDQFEKAWNEHCLGPRGGSQQ
jgi:hypothetical protein